jgi:LacI family transcriptional regulator
VVSTIGVIVHKVNDPIMSSLISGVEEVAAENAINVVISQSLGKYKNEKTLVKTLLNARIGGLIVWLANDTDDTDHFKEFIRFNIPVVFVDRKPEGFASKAVVVDYFTACYLATSHLIDQGCKRVAFLGGQNPHIYSEKLRGYLASLKAHGISNDENLIIKRSSVGVKESYEWANRLFRLQEPPDAIFCDNDILAVGVIQYAKNHGIPVPDELAVLGFNDDPISRMIEPALSTIAHPALEMGIVAAQMLLYQNKGEEINMQEIILDPKLVARQSTLKGVTQLKAVD